MSQTEDKLINELVTELLDEVKTENKEPVPNTTQTEPNSVDSEKKESQETNPFASAMGNGMPKIDLSQANKLFSGLIKSFIPPELKKNKDVQKMFDMFFKDDKTKKEDVQDKLENEDVQKDDEDVEDVQEEDTEDVEDVDTADIENEDTEDEDVQDEDTEDESQDNVQENEDSQDEDCDCDNCEYESVKYAFVIMRDDKPIAYTKKFKYAQKYMNKLYRNLIIKHADVFTKTVHELGSIRVYERKVYTLFPFQDTLMAHFSIKQVPNVA